MKQDVQERRRKSLEAKRLKRAQVAKTHLRARNNKLKK